MSRGRFARELYGIGPGGSGARRGAVLAASPHVVELAVRLIGTPVLAEGSEVGKLADISITDEGHVDKIRISTASRLGFGARIVEIRAGAFKIRRNAVVLDMPPDALDALPTADAPSEDREDR